MIINLSVKKINTTVNIIITVSSNDVTALNLIEHMNEKIRNTREASIDTNANKGENPPKKSIIQSIRKT